MTSRASVIIPTHDKPSTLPLTVDTVLRQTVPDLEVILLGDGVTDDVRRVAEDLVALDSRVRFLDLPKGPHHGERHRHDAIEAADSDAIFYLCDDDLLLPDHVADLLELLVDHNVVQCRNSWVTAQGGLRFYAADLSDPATVALHLRDDIRFNSISITGTAHSRQFYREVGDRWDTTPAGWWPDHHQFRKLLRHPGYRGATSGRVTALQFPTSADDRDSWTADERLAELRPWHRLVTGPGAQDHVDRLCRAGELAQLVEDRATNAELHAALVRDHAIAAEQLEVATRETAEWRRVADERLALAEEHIALIESLQERIRGLNERIARKDEALRRLRAERRSPAGEASGPT